MFIELTLLNTARYKLLAPLMINSESNQDLPLPHQFVHPVYGFKFRPQTGPFPFENYDPSLSQCVKNFGLEEYGLWALTTSVPAILGLSYSRIKLP
jgi:hypothetical protein